MHIRRKIPFMSKRTTKHSTLHAANRLRIQTHIFFIFRVVSFNQTAEKTNELKGNWRSKSKEQKMYRRRRKRKICITVVWIESNRCHNFNLFFIIFFLLFLLCVSSCFFTLFYSCQLSIFLLFFLTHSLKSFLFIGINIDPCHFFHSNYASFVGMYVSLWAHDVLCDVLCISLEVTICFFAFFSSFHFLSFCDLHA